MIQNRLPHSRATGELSGRRDETPMTPCYGHGRLYDAVLDNSPGTRAHDMAVRECKAICATCPLTGFGGPCQTLLNDEPGVVGGMTVEERQGLEPKLPRGCASPGCGAPFHARGLCQSHYNAARAAERAA